ncbi:hypothetical protein XENOCAPTIV_009650 [Xenoophorus captivus]|uniref:Uncharacterized protein n=1 Tax=Xenoophorus captivus TaxID=1517983 RepID=A0ABV0RGL4_9TELE
MFGTLLIHYNGRNENGPFGRSLIFSYSNVYDKCHTCNEMFVYIELLTYSFLRGFCCNTSHGAGKCRFHWIYLRALTTGKELGVKRGLRNRRFNSSNTHQGKVRSLGDKMDELAGLNNTQPA